MFNDQVSAIVIIIIETHRNSLKNHLPPVCLFKKVAEMQLVPLSSRLFFLNFALFCLK